MYALPFYQTGREVFYEGYSLSLLLFLKGFFSFHTATKEKKQKNAAHYNWIIKIIVKKIMILITKTFFMLKLMSTIVSILLLLISWIKAHVLDPIARSVLLKEIKEKNAKCESSDKEIRRLKEELEKK